MQHTTKTLACNERSGCLFTTTMMMIPEREGRGIGKGQKGDGDDDNDDYGRATRREASKEQGGDDYGFGNGKGGGDSGMDRKGDVW